MNRPELLAYIPVLNQRHINWLSKYRESNLFLIPQSVAVKLLPRLNRDLSAIPTELLARSVNALGIVHHACKFSPQFDQDFGRDWILPDEEISHIVAEKYLIPEGYRVKYEMIWARWDMTAVMREQPVILDSVISAEEFDREILKEASELARQSPDWWRQVGAIVFDRNGRTKISAFNTHMPNEYETYIFGDPAINRDAGERGKSCALHAEASCIALSARYRLNVYYGKIYTTTFPCESCAGLIVVAGIRKVYFREGYSSLNAQEIFRAHGVEVIQVKDGPVSA